MPRVSDLLAALDRLPDACGHCGSVLVHVGGPAGLVTVCPGCDLRRPPRAGSIAVGVCACADCVRARRSRA